MRVLLGLFCFGMVFGEVEGFFGEMLLSGFSGGDALDQMMGLESGGLFPAMPELMSFGNFIHGSMNEKSFTLTMSTPCRYVLKWNPRATIDDIKVLVNTKQSLLQIKYVFSEQTDTYSSRVEKFETVGISKDCIFNDNLAVAHMVGWIKKGEEKEPAEKEAVETKGEEAKGDATEGEKKGGEPKEGKEGTVVAEENEAKATEDAKGDQEGEGEDDDEGNPEDNDMELARWSPPLVLKEGTQLSLRGSRKVDGDIENMDLDDPRNPNKILIVFPERPRLQKYEAEGKLPKGLTRALIRNKPIDRFNLTEQQECLIFRASTEEFCENENSKKDDTPTKITPKTEKTKSTPKAPTTGKAEEVAKKTEEVAKKTEEVAKKTEEVAKKAGEEAKKAKAVAKGGEDEGADEHYDIAEESRIEDDRISEKFDLPEESRIEEDSEGFMEDNVMASEESRISEDSTASEESIIRPGNNVERKVSTKLTPKKRTKTNKVAKKGDTVSLPRMSGRFEEL